jgi:hypothetical protein
MKMFPPSAPIYWNTRPRWQGSNEISRREIGYLNSFPKGRKIERIRMNKHDEPEYVVITYENDRFVVNILTPSVRRGYLGPRNMFNLVEYLNKELGFVSVI